MSSLLVGLMGLKGSVGGVENPESPDGAVGRAAMEGQERAGVRTPIARTEQRTS